MSLVEAQFNKAITEAAFQKRVLNELGKLSNCYFFTKEAKSIRGIPDIVGCRNGHFFAMELKKSLREAQKTTGRIVLQKYTLQQVDKAYGLAYLVHPENLNEVLEDFGKRSDRKLILS